MVIYYDHPFTAVFLIIVAVSLVAGLIASANGFAEMMTHPDKETESLKTSGRVAGWCLLLIIISVAGMCVLNHNQDRTLSSIDSYISADGSMVTIEALPNHYMYYKFDNDSRPNNESRQVFKFVENPEYKSAHLVSEDGGKFKLSDEDKEYLKQRLGQ